MTWELVWLLLPISALALVGYGGRGLWAENHPPGSAPVRGSVFIADAACFSDRTKLGGAGRVVGRQVVEVVIEDS